MKNFDLIKIFTKEEADDIVSSLQTSDTWLDGKLSTGSAIRYKKVNFELDGNADIYQKLYEKLREKIYNNQELVETILPKRLVNFMVNRYNVGGKYGGHYDEELMHDRFSGEPLRCDYSFSLFLNDNFEGGQLKVEGQYIKPKQGYGCFYKSNLYHSVTEVRSGERFAMVGWMESLIKDHEAREAISSIDQCIKYFISADEMNEKIYKQLNRARQIMFHKFL